MFLQRDLAARMPPKGTPESEGGIAQAWSIEAPQRGKIAASIKNGHDNEQ